MATDNNVYLSDLQALIVEHFSLEELRARAAGAGDESQVMLATTGGYVFGYWVDQTQLIGRACPHLPMNINWDNWLRYFSGQPYQCSCSDLPPHPTVLAAVDAGAITMAEDAMCAPADTSR